MQYYPPPSTGLILHEIASPPSPSSILEEIMKLPPPEIIKYSAPPAEGSISGWNTRNISQEAFTPPP